MQHPETDLTTIAQLAEKREDENYRFRVFLRSEDEEQVDRIVYQLNENISAKIDCTKCGNCCRSMMVSITAPERKVFEEHFGLGEEAVVKKYLAEGMGENTIMSNMPCIFLDDNKCSIYEKRFVDCRQFPHLDQKGFVTRMFSMIHNYSICPIVFNVMEALKDEMSFKREMG